MIHLDTIDTIEQDYEILYYKQYIIEFEPYWLEDRFDYYEFLIDYEPEWLVELTELKGSWVNDKLKIDLIFRINHLEDIIKSLPETLKKLRDKYIYTPISKKEYIADMSLIDDYEIYIIDAIIENIN
jgi:hypothetical protein